METNDEKIIIYSQMESSESSSHQYIKTINDKIGICLIVLAIIVIATISDVLTTDIRILNGIWVVIPVIILMFSIQLFRLIGFREHKSRTQYERIEKSGTRLFFVISAMYLMALLELFHLIVAHNVETESFYSFLAAIYLIALIAFEYRTHGGLRKNKWMVVPIALICIIETFVFNLTFATTSYVDGVVVDKHLSGGRSVIYCLDINSQNKTRTYKVYGDVYTAAKVDDTVSIQSKESIFGIIIAEVLIENDL